MERRMMLTIKGLAEGHERVAGNTGGPGARIDDRRVP
jgi:hypothetical protein